MVQLHKSTVMVILCVSSLSNAFSQLSKPSSTTSGTLASSSNNITLLRQQQKLEHNINNDITSSLYTISMSKTLSVRGGALLATPTSLASSISSNPTNLFNANLAGLALATTCIRLFGYLKTKGKNDDETAKAASTAKPAKVKSLQIRFLAVFWLLRCADWLQGPYFYETYSSKVFNGVPASLSTVSKLFLTGFASTALFGPIVGRMSDNRGRKKGTLAFTILYMLGAASTKSNVLKVLLLGRVMGGIGTSLLFSAPEAWFVGEATKKGSGDEDGKYLGETFGLAYAGDSIVAIIAGQLAGVAAGKRGPTGAFELSIGFLAIGGILLSFLWKENKAESVSSSDGGDSSSNSPSIRDAVVLVKDDPKIMLLGAVQSLFEAAMYIFVLQWPPAMSKVISKTFGASASTPYGTIFSCFMASCLLGSTIFSQLTKVGVPTELFTSVMLSVATAAMGLATFLVSTSSSSGLVTMPLAAMVAAFFAFEGCVGLYFPSIGTLRSKYVPDSHRTVIMNLFGIPLNALVVSVFLSINKLGVNGALSVSTSALALATVSMIKLRSIVNKGDEK